MKETEDREKREELEKGKLEIMEKTKKKKKQKRGFVPSQIYLLQQQLQQHVQLTTQHFLQTFQHPRYFYYAETCKTMLVCATLITTKGKIRKLKLNPCDKELKSIPVSMSEVLHRRNRPTINFHRPT